MESMSKLNRRGWMKAGAISAGVAPFAEDLLRAFGRRMQVQRQGGWAWLEGGRRKSCIRAKGYRAGDSWRSGCRRLGYQANSSRSAIS